MNDLFRGDSGAAAFRADNDPPEHNRNTTVRKRRDDLSGVLNDVAPDIVVVVEGPNRTDELQLFFDQDVQGTWQTWVQPSTGQSQCVGVAVRVDQGKFQNPAFTAFNSENMSAFADFAYDTDGDDVRELHHFERKPLYAEIRPTGGSPFRILGLHLKSKGIFSAYEWSKWWEIADGNRRKLLAQSSHLRLEFLDPFMTTVDTKSIPLIVCGDINDGPGLDASEKRLFGSAIERLMGTIWKPELCLHNALFESLPVKDQAVLNFDKIATASFKDPIFDNVWQRDWIDHILYTPKAGAPWVHAAEVITVLPDGSKIWKKYAQASDHYPVAVAVTP